LRGLGATEGFVGKYPVDRERDVAERKGIRFY
jgi:hypothetical protein